MLFMVQPLPIQLVVLKYSNYFPIVFHIPCLMLKPPHLVFLLYFAIGEFMRITHIFLDEAMALMVNRLTHDPWPVASPRLAFLQDPGARSSHRRPTGYRLLGAELRLGHDWVRHGSPKSPEVSTYEVYFHDTSMTTGWRDPQFEWCGFLEHDDEPNKMKRKSECFGEIHRFSSFPNKAHPLLDGMILQIDHLVIYIARRAWNSTIIRDFPLHFFGGYILFLVQPCASSAVKHSPLEIHL